MSLQQESHYWSPLAVVIRVVVSRGRIPLDPIVTYPAPSGRNTQWRYVVPSSVPSVLEILTLTTPKCDVPVVSQLKPLLVTKINYITMRFNITLNI